MSFINYGSSRNRTDGFFTFFPFFALSCTSDATERNRYGSTQQLMKKRSVSSSLYNKDYRKLIGVFIAGFYLFMELTLGTFS